MYWPDVINNPSSECRRSFNPYTASVIDSKSTMQTAEVKVGAIESHLVIQPFNFLRETDSFSRDTIVLLSECKILTFDKTCWDCVRIDILPNHRPVNYLHEMIALPHFYHLAIFEILIWNNDWFLRSPSLSRPWKCDFVSKCFQTRRLFVWYVPLPTIFPALTIP